MASLRTWPRRRLAWSVVALVVVVAVVLGVITQVRASAEAKKHDPYGEAATVARARADGTLAAALDEAAIGLGLSTPLGNAMYDSCTVTNPTSMDLSITCSRERYRVYTIAGALLDAHSLATKLAPQWGLGDTFCDADLKLDTVCLQEKDVALELIVEPASKTPHGIGLSRWPQVSSTRVEYSSLENSQFTGPIIVMEASSTYFVG